MLLLIFLVVVTQMKPTHCIVTRNDNSIRDNERNIWKINENILGEFFESDIETTNNKNAIRDNSLRWTPPIPFVISERYGNVIRSKIMAAIDEYSVRTCISFRPKTDKDDRYIFIADKNGCHSGVGMSTKNGPQTISIGSGCEGHSTILHELMHRLGFWHEQSRYDRDIFVKIIWDNIKEGQRHNFKKYSRNEANTMETLYDYHSVMHYPSTAYSIDGSPTIIALKKGVNVGKKSQFTKLDIEKNNKLYDCATNNLYDVSGFTDWTNWSECDVNCGRSKRRWCDDEVVCREWGVVEEEEISCEQCEENVNPDCKVIFIKSVGIVTSPFFPYSYVNNLDCITTIKTEEEDKIIIDFDYVDMETLQDSSSCPYDFLQIYDGDSIGSRLVSKLCDIKLPHTITSAGNAITLRFQTDDSVQKGGFMAYWTTVRNPILFRCNFQHDWKCSWKDVDNLFLKWKVQKGNSPSSNTGPDGDHTFDAYTTATEHVGSFMYMEASTPAKKGDKAFALTHKILGGSEDCLTFWYCMYGTTVGRLNVYWISTHGFNETVFSQLGNHGKKWFESRITLSTNFMHYQILFEAERGRSWTGDIAVDDIMIHKGPC